MRPLSPRALTACAAWLLLAPAAFASDTLKLAVGQRGSWETAISELGQTAGIFKKHGLDLQIVYTQGTGETLQAVISSSVDVGIATGIFGVMGAYAKGAPIRAIGSTMTGANDLLWYVRADSPIKSMTDTAGKTVAYSTTGSSSHQSVLGFSGYYKVDLKPVATGSPPSTLTQVLSGQIDVGWAVVPFAVEAADAGKVRIIAKAGDLPAFQHKTIRLIAVNADTLKAKRAALTEYLQAYRETLDWMYSDPAALRAYANFAQLPEAVAKRVRDDLIPKNDLDTDRLAGLEDSMTEAVGFKFLSAPLPKERSNELLQIPFR